MKKAIFNTKIAADEHLNGQIVEIREQKEMQCLLIFPDGHELWAYLTELTEIND